MRQMIASSPAPRSALLHRDSHFIPKKAIGGKGCYIFLEDGTQFLDSTGGAAVSCLGHGNEEVQLAIKKQTDQISYCHTAFFGTDVAEELAQFLVDSTGGLMSKVFIVSSGKLTTLPSSGYLLDIYQHLIANEYRLGGRRSGSETSSSIFS